MEENNALRGVWLVTEGCYSDFHVVGVFSTEEKAKAYTALFGGSDTYIEEWDLDPFEKEVRKGVRCYSIEMDEEGNVGRIEVQGLPAPESYFWRWPEHFNRSGFFGRVNAKNEKHATKIANERRRQLIAHPELDQ